MEATKFKHDVESSPWGDLEAAVTLLVTQGAVKAKLS